MNISFGSTYKVTTAGKQNNFEKFGEFNNLCIKNANKSGVTTLLKDKFIDTSYMGLPTYEATRTLIAPDKMDDEIEAYCANKGIKYTKYTTAELLSGQNILNRIAEAPKGMKTVFINTKKLDKYLQKQDSNIKHCKNDYDRYYANDVKNILKSGDEIPAPTMYIQGSRGRTVKAITDYIEKYGNDKLNDKQISVWLQQTTTKPDHCVYFALKNMGMKHIPVYVDKDSYEVGKALELFD